MKELMLKLFDHCIPVKGFTRSIICDTQRNQFDFIPNALFDILSKDQGKTANEIKSNYTRNQIEIIDDYLTFLENKNYVFWTSEPHLFPDIDRSFETPSVITNAIIEAGQYLLKNIDSIIDQLDDLGCKALEIRAYNPIDFEDIEKITSASSLSKIRTIHIILKHNEHISSSQYKSLHEMNPRIRSICIHSSPEDRQESLDFSGNLTLSFTSTTVSSEKCCGLIHPNYFTPNLHALIESQENNSCLNRKVAITQQGNITNCPSMNHSFGCIETKTIRDVVTEDEFQSMWRIRKDQVKVCQDCEFRHICTDCRAYVEDPEDLHSKPLKCGYDPYNGKWEDWSANPLKQKAIEYYDLKTITEQVS
ncbi:MAG: grasp-with-spasm system SPASM domain peptide maturase [Flavobacteriales bacterium]|nr:grasp-with-spasm system SPASM domain peptide maturase [Flavobacteriales bacterium]